MVYIFQTNSLQHRKGYGKIGPFLGNPNIITVNPHITLISLKTIGLTV